MVADLGAAAQPVAGSQAGNGEEIGVAAEDQVAEEGGLVGEDDVTGVGVDLLDVDVAAQGDAQALALADGVVGDALVAAQDIAGLVDVVAGAGHLHEDAV